MEITNYRPENWDQTSDNIYIICEVPHKKVMTHLRNSQNGDKATKERHDISEIVIKCSTRFQEEPTY